MADFQAAFKNTMRFEDSVPSGRVTDEPNGGKARFGINSIAHPDLPDNFWYAAPEYAVLMAQKIELEGYWQPLHLDDMLNQEVANKIFDMAVNMGTKEAAVLAQRACNMGEYGQQLQIDGILGPASLQAINAFPPDAMLEGLRDLSVAYYQHIEQIHPADVAWNGSWMARARA